MEALKNLPQEVQAKVKNLLTVYNEATVVFENGVYKVSSSICITATYAKDHKVVGRFKVNDVYTKEEQIINYIEQFHEYPIEFKGTKDYNLIRKLKWGDKIQMVGDTFEILTK